MGLRNLVLDTAPLRESPAFRAVFIARTVSLLGIGMAAVALSDQVYDLTGSSFGVAVTVMVMSLTMLLGSLAGGVVADRMDRRPLIIVSRTAAGLGFAGLAANAFVDEPSLWAVYVCVGWNGLANGVSTTALMAATPTLVQPRQLPAAGALISLTGHLGSVVAPFMGGVVIALWEPGWAYTATAVSTALTVLLLTRVGSLPPRRVEGEGDTTSLGSAFRFAVRHPTVGGLLALGAVTAVFSVPTVLFPEFVDKRFGGDEMVLGLLYTAPAVGAMIVSLTSGWLGTTRRPGLVLLGAAFLGGLATVGFGLSGALPVALVMLAATGAAGVVYEVLEYSLVQHHTPDGLRGRINGVLNAEDTSGRVLAGAEAAALARWFNPGGAAVVNGAVCAAAALLAAVCVPGLRRATLARKEADTAP
ncbi:enterobactin transporter EntS [Actinocorallia populi]|uniref:enterobactin transporter EntS n=1 Tax=Actinocorallia populi TaxID=2079200 RepID=UPI000D08EBE9|nr:enterobactin transporter EntS [Actinocorallia populi]